MANSDQLHKTNRTHFSTNLVTALTSLQVNNFTHFEERRELFLESEGTTASHEGVCGQI